jgi:hypothetical protein
VNFHADRPKSTPAPRPCTAFLTDAMQHEQKIRSTKHIAIARLHDSARHDKKFSLVK